MNYHDSSDSELWARLRTGDWLDRQNFPPLQWAVPGIIPEGFGLLVGGPKVGKSWLALSILLAIARGTEALGAVDPGNARPVLYMALEDGDRRMKRRAKHLAHGADLPANLAYITDARPTEVTGFIRDWLSVHGSSGTVVILDTLGKVMPPAHAGESAYARDYRVGSELKAAIDDYPGSTLLAVHHTRKQASEDFMESVSGTNGLNGAADFTIVLARSRNSENGTLQVTGRDVDENVYGVTNNDGHWSMIGGDLESAARAAGDVEARDGLADLSQQVLNLVNEAPDGITAKTVAAMVPGLNGDNNAAGVYLRRLVDSERIRKDGRGKFAPIPARDVFPDALALA